MLRLTPLRRFTAWAIGGAPSDRNQTTLILNEVPFRNSVRAKFLVASLLLLLIPLSGFVFVRELASYLRLGQEQVTVATAKLVAASLSDRPGLQLRRRVALVAPAAPVAEAETPATTDPERDRVLALFGASDASIAASLGARYAPDAAVERILNQGVASDARVWVVDLAGNVRGLAGALYEQKTQGGYERALAAATRWLATGKVNLVANDVIDSRDAVLAQSERALLGQPNIEWRTQQGGGISVLSAAEPIWQGDAIVASVIVEQSDTSQRALANRAAQSVIMVSVLVFAVAFSVLLWFAFGLSRRLTNLQKDANAAVDGQGRASGVIRATSEADEIGSLSRTLAAMVARQASYNQYLEKLAGRLSHELRTPVAVVRSSLDNLRAGTLGADDRKYLERADEGVARLSNLISRMSEATQLEQMLQGAEMVRLDFGALVEGCVSGYRLAFPKQTFTFEPPDQALWVMAVPDAIAQMLDKLVQNAVDFATPGSPIAVQVSYKTQTERDMRECGVAVLSVENTGALLPADTSTLFESMVSVRPSAQNDGHLGLGLYIARLVAEFHGGTISARNRADESGVAMCVELGAKSSTGAGRRRS